VIANAVQRLDAEIERGQRHVRPPGGVIEAALNEGIECFFAGVSTRTVTAVVSQGDGLGESHVQSEWSSDTGRDLGDFQGVRQSGAHMVVRKDEDLGFAGQAAKRVRVQDAIAVALEARAKLVGLFVALALSPPKLRVAPGTMSASSCPSRPPGDRKARDDPGADSPMVAVEFRWATVTSSLEPS